MTASSGGQSGRPATVDRSRSLPTSKRRNIREDGSRGSDRQGERGRSVRQGESQCRSHFPKPPGGTAAFGQRNRNREAGRVAISASDSAGTARQQCLVGLERDRQKPRGFCLDPIRQERRACLHRHRSLIQGKWGLVATPAPMMHELVARPMRLGQAYCDLASLLNFSASS